MKIQKLSNGVEIPSLGFGTYLIQDGEESRNSVKTAIELGYRHIDCAAAYGNEKSVGLGIAESGLAREELFITSKVWNSEQGYETTLKAFDKTLQDLGLDYLDLYLIHWPKPLSGETWRAMEELLSDGKVRAIGVCNFTIEQMDELLKTAKVVPMVNQIELHPQFPQYELQTYCKDKGIAIESWGPLMQGQIFDHSSVADLAKKHNCSVAQLAVAWQFMQENIALVKSTKPERIRSNFNIPEINFSEEDMKVFKALEGARIGADPDNFDF